MNRKHLAEFEEKNGVYYCNVRVGEDDVAVGGCRQSLPSGTTVTIIMADDADAMFIGTVEPFMCPKLHVNISSTNRSSMVHIHVERYVTLQVDFFAGSCTYPRPRWHA